MNVRATLESLNIPTYPVGVPEKNPVFFEKRVYQGSSGKVYPVPFIDKVFDQPEPVAYQAATLENEFVKLVMLPEIGGRIFTGQDKTRGNYDFFYRQDVIKPALVGLAGPWISGGVEFNWPQHHRPGTFMPCDVWIEEEDGARTVWMSEHDPIHRLKGMHGIRLREGSSLIELRARLCNRTPLTRTFLWWANVAAMVHDQYQSFFPPDVHYVADHAVRAMSSFPEANNPYYGVDYQNRPGANDLSWYRNIPVPTSYMICQTAFDFFGGYDHSAGAGFVHVADRHIAPGKKQWTWGNHPFGYAWDRELTDANGPYIELMAGVYTDNQPDFTYLAPYETKTFSQYWWPIQDIGPVQQANTEAALRMVVHEDRGIELGLCVSTPIEDARLVLTHRGQVILDERITLRPGESWTKHGLRFDGEHACELHVLLESAEWTDILSYSPPGEESRERKRELATEPPAPGEIASNDELYFTGEHLELYRHPTREPEPYWQEALRRDEGDFRSNLALGRRLLNRGLLSDAEGYFRRAVARITRRHPNPETAEAHYHLGICLVLQGGVDEACEWLAKATWDQAWKGAALYHLACIDCRRGELELAAERLDGALALNLDHHKAQVLLAVIRRKLGHPDGIDLLCDVIDADPLDHWARCELMLAGELTQGDFLKGCRNDAQTILDLVFDYADAGWNEDAAGLLQLHLENPVVDAAVPNPLCRAVSSRYVLAWLKQDQDLLAEARNQSPDYFFPSRIQEQVVLEWALAQEGGDPVAAYGLGNYLYDRKRHQEAIACWQRSVDDGANFATVHRNLGIGIWNVKRDGEAARASYLKAMELDPGDPRLVSEFDQLRSKLNDDPAARLADLEAKRDLVDQRDDCTVALLDLLNLAGRSEDALELLTSRRFHPWEGGEGSVLRQFTRAHLLLGRRALEAGDARRALEHFENAMNTPDNLGEAYHLLQAKADVNYWRGAALKALGRDQEAMECFQASADEVGDFAEMAVTEHSPLSYYRGLSLRAMGREDESLALFESLKAFAKGRLGETARIDYFATSLPNLLVFEEDLQARKDAEAQLMIALASHGLGDAEGARHALEAVMRFNRADAVAAELGQRM